MLFVKVGETENPEDSVEIPVEPQGYILMSTLTAQFPGACGLKFKTEQFSWRGVRVVEDKLYPPGDDKWDSSVYVVTFPKDSKRKGDDLDINTAKSRKIERKCVDLIVLGIPWKSTEEVVRRYFEQYGEVVLCEIKRDSSNNSKGFGFVRFKEYNNQCSVLGKKHFIDGRWCDVKIPNSQEPETSRKIFVGRLTEQLTSQDLQDYFSQYGQVIDVYIPKPFRAFGFVTFVEADIAQGLCGESHIIKGVSVHVSRADPKDDDSHSNGHHPPGHHHHSHHHHHGNGHHHSNHSSFQNHYNDNGPSSNGHYGSHRNESSRRFSSNGGGLGSNHMSGSKSMGQIRKKYDHHSNSSNSNEMYESRHSNVRSPNMPPPPPPQSSSHHHSSHHNNNNANNPLNGNNSNDQMNAMMSMFNPMMQAFISQLAAQSMGPNSGQTMEQVAQNGAAAAAAAVASLTGGVGGVGGGIGGHHQSLGPGPAWDGNNNFGGNNGPVGVNGRNIMPNNSNGMPNNYNNQGYAGGGRFKSKIEKYKLQTSNKLINITQHLQTP